MDIDQLPLEVLNLVFLQLQIVYPIHSRKIAKGIANGRENVTPHIVNQLMLGWINATFVSRSWREWALSSPRLWAQIPFVLGQTWAKAFLQRSQPAPIIVHLGNMTYWRVIYPVEPWIAPFICDISPRTQNLRIYFETNTDAARASDSFDTLILQTFEQLTTLDLKVSWQHIGASLLTSEKFPRLRSLTLGLPNANPHEFPWDDIATLPLTILDMQFTAHPVTASVFPNLFRALSRLETLTKLGIACRFQDEQMQGQDLSCTCGSNMISPRFPALEQLCLSSRSSMALHVLQHITFPAWTKLKIDTPLDNPLFTSTLMPAISSAHSHKSYQQLSLVLNDRPPRLLAARSPDTLSDAADLDLVLDANEPISPLDALVSLCGDTIQHLNIHLLHSGFDFKEVSSLFSLSKICYVHVTMEQSSVFASMFLQAFLDALLTPYTSEAKRTPLPFPELRILDLRDAASMITDANAKRRNPPETGRSVLPWFMDSLVKIMATRHKGGVPMSCIYMSDVFEAEGAKLSRRISEIKYAAEGADYWCRPSNQHWQESQYDMPVIERLYY